MKSVHYIETSALNLFADELRDFDFNLLYQKAMGVDLCISPVVLWEVLLNTDNGRKEALLYWAQFNCADYLLKSPAETIIQYLKAGAPLKDRKDFYLNRATTLRIGATWSSIHRKIDRTIPVNVEELQQRANPLRALSRSYKDIIRSMTNEAERGNDTDYFHRMMIKLRESLAVPVIQSQKNDALTKTALILGYFVVCIGVDLDNTPVRDYWEAKKIDDPVERLEFLVKDQPVALVRGPLMEMALMMNAQIEMSGGANRGTVFDALHTIYCYYAHNTISNDPHFTNLSGHTKNKVYESIVRADKYLEMMKIAYAKLTTA